MLRSSIVLAMVAVALGSGGCDSGQYEPCAGKACGDACTVCAPDDAGCVETAVVKACDSSGACVADGGAGCPAP